MKDRIILAATVAFSVLALQGVLGFFPDAISNLWKILIGIGGGVLVVLYGERFMKALGVK